MATRAKRTVERRIVTRGCDSHVDHRSDFTSCPSCDHQMDNDGWEKAAVELVLDPAVYKSGSVAVVSECPKCFAKSWVHERMYSFDFSDHWPDDWKKAVKQREASVRLVALREWGGAICHRCAHLKSGTVEYHAWRECVAGLGPAMRECEKFKAIE